MNNNKNDGLKFFLLGIGTYLMVPVAESISSWMQSVINKSIMKMQNEAELDRAEHQAAVDVIQPTEKNPVAAVGFQYDNPEDDEEYYEEE